MLAGIPAGTFWRKDRPTPSRGAHTSLHSSSTPIDRSSPAEVDLRDLNASLAALAAIFPDIRPEVFREMLSSLSDVSRLQLVTENLLKHKAQFVRGRWNVPPTQHSVVPGQCGTVTLPLKDQFRSVGYKAAVKAAFYQEFKGLSHSTVKAVLAEHNYSYADTRGALLSLASTSWRFSLANMVRRRKAPSADEHPFVEWRTSPSGNPEPALIRINNAELARELEESILAPLLREKVATQVHQDRELAQRLNESEAEVAGCLYECECCFSSSTFEAITTCGHGHYTCFTCIRHTMTEAIYGQGWAKSVDVDQHTLKCIALSAGNNAQCDGFISQASVRKICSGETTSTDSWQKFEERLAQECLSRSHLQVLRCPFCVYAEYDDAAATDSLEESRHGNITILFLSMLGMSSILRLLGINPYEFLFSCCLVLVATIMYKRKFFGPLLNSQPTDFGSNDHHGRKFICRNVHCSRVSCLRCSAPWTDVHICYQSSRQALRTYVESAVTEAVKRTCPRCNLAFVKSSGCNKLVCVCGYTMCYVCRADIGTEGYMHFCQHFRPDAGQSCKECDKCDLYRVEDEEIVIRRAKEVAVKEWKEREAGNNSNGKDKGHGWNVEHEADGIGDSVTSWRKTGWLQT